MQFENCRKLMQISNMRLGIYLKFSGNKNKTESFNELKKYVKLINFQTVTVTNKTEYLK